MVLSGLDHIDDGTVGALRTGVLLGDVPDPFGPTVSGLQLAAQMATTGDGTKMGPLVPSVLVRLEGAALATLAVYLYVEFGGAGSSSLP